MENQRVDEIAALLHLGGFTRAMRLDAGETAVLARALELIDTELYEMPGFELKGSLLVPMKSDIDPGVQTYTYRSIRGVGRGKAIANYADDLPRVDLYGEEASSKFLDWGASYAYSLNDLRAARLTGFALDTARATLAREVIARDNEDMIFFGYSPVGITGFANNASVQLVTPTTGNWATATAAQILADLIKMELAIITNSSGRERPDTLALPTIRFAQLNTKFMGTDGDGPTVLDFYRDRSIGVKNIEETAELETADAAGTGPRAVMYRRDRAVLEGLQPIEFESLPPEPRNLSWNVNCVSRVGGVVVRRPGAMAYMDGI